MFRLFKKLLVANRGEIAIRILRACRELNIPSVAVFSEADRGAMHVRYADEAYCLGAPPASESYLNIGKIIDASLKAGVDAIHPGYGFLAENAEFAEACQKAGIVFVGPSARTIRLLGNKIAARRLAAERGLPVLAGTAAITDPDEAMAVAEQIGYPVLIKAAAGGGGRGIRNVTRREEMAGAIQSASSEAMSAFGDGGIFVEKFISPARHIEVQVIADRYGNTLALAERECSIQRRHQKLIEECPSPAIQAELRARLNEAAVTIAQAAEYVNVGTVEFLLDTDHNFYFLEMNTRLQVEHPVTEIVTGADLVADQIRVAAGDPLGYSRESFSNRGWAIECRISAEDPAHGFVPSVGQIVFAREPAGPGIRVESALYDGIRVSEFYDPLVAKVTAWGRDRREAIRRMQRALEEFKIVGVQTNIPFHVAMLNDSRFLAGELDTEMVERGLPAAPIDGREAGQMQAALAMAALLQHARREGHALGGALPFDAADPPRNGHAATAAPWRLAGRSASTSRAGASGWRRPTG